MALENSIGFNDLTITETSQDNDELLIQQGDYTKRITKEHLFPVTGTVEAGNNYPVTSAGVDTAIKAKDAENIKKTAQTLTEAEKLQARSNIGLTDEQIKEIVKSEIEKEAYFKAGDTYTIGNGITSAGYVSGSSQNIRFMIPVAKNLKNLKPTINSIKVNIRGSAGAVLGYVGTQPNMGYVNGGTEIKEYISSIQTTSSRAGNFITLNFDVPTKWYIGNTNTPNNYPVVVEVNSFSFTLTNP